jgi:sulfide:quinone oxidoreductase
MAARVLILGGGFGGVAAANELRRSLPAEHEIVVIDREPTFHVGAGKTWIMLGERTVQSVSQRRAALLRDGIRLVEASVRAIDVSKRSVEIDGETLEADVLVIALGADVNLGAVPGLKEAAHTFYTVEGAERLKGEIDRFRGGDCVILIPRTPFKCPPAPYEAAMMLHHELDKRAVEKVRIAIYTVESAPMATAGPDMGDAIRGELESRGIEFHPQKKTQMVDATTRSVVFEDGSQASFTLLIAVPPHEAPKVVRDAGLVNEAGWIPVDPRTLEWTGAGKGEIYAIGDVTAIPLPGRFKPEVPLFLPKAGVLADAQGRVVARRIAARLTGKEPSDVFDGKGNCYLEVGGERALKAEGSFFEMPHPVMQKAAPDEAQFREKVNWVVHSLKPVRRS